MKKYITKKTDRNPIIYPAMSSPGLCAFKTNLEMNISVVINMMKRIKIKLSILKRKVINITSARMPAIPEECKLIL